MKKKLVSLVLVAAAVFSMCVPAFATKGFNKRVFDDHDNLQIITDDMEGETGVYLASQYDGSMSTFISSDTFITVRPRIFLNDRYDFFILGFDYLGKSLAGMDSITFKIGDNRYTFSNCYTSRSYDDGFFYETICFYMKKETTLFMKDFAKHRDDEIRVRINGSFQTIDFIFSDTEKANLLDLYDLYSSGKGTRETNLSKITNADQVIVAKNGEVIDAHIVEKALDALFSAADSIRREQVIDSLIDSGR